MNPFFYRLCRALLSCFFTVWNRLTVRAIESPFQTGEGFIIAANHTSYLDPPVLSVSIRNTLTFMAKEELFGKNRFFALIIRALGAIPIASESDFRSLRTVIRALRAGKAILMFPEGTRSLNDDFLEPQSGVAFLAYAARVNVIPCYIQGTADAMAPGQKWIRPKKICVFFDRPYRVPERPSKGRNEFYSQCAREIMSRIAGLKARADREAL